jgi:16S rRNA (guanine966-N2)-methyltransferase
MRIVGGKFRGKKIISPTHEGTRPTSDRTREMIFNILLHNPAFGSKVLLDKRVLDVFAGTGALGLEAYSRGAESVTFIEKDRETLSILRINVKAFDLPHMYILEQDATALRQKPSSPFDLVFLDPPYHQDLVLPTLTQLMTHGWLSQNAVIVVEIAKNESPHLSPLLSLILERTSGAAKVLFCVLKA